MDDHANPVSDDRALSRRGFAGLGLAAGLAASGAAAADTVVESDVSLNTADGICDAALFHPAGKAKHPGVVIFPDALGLRPAFRDMGRRLAAEGYAVLVPNPFYRVKKAPVIEGPFDFNKPEDRAKLTDLRKGIDADAVSRDAAAFIAFLDKHPTVTLKCGIGVQGYCMGGAYVFRAAAAVPDRVAAAASFHGGGLVTDQPDSPHLLIPKTKAQFLIAVADNDDQRQPDAKDKLTAAFAAAGRPAVVEVYKGANHGWCVPGSPIYNAAAAEKAWAALLSLYGKALA
jgi:carboxymethylenebutenolidase